MNNEEVYKKTLQLAGLKWDQNMAGFNLEHGLENFKCPGGGVSGELLDCGVSFMRSYANSHDIPIATILFVWRFANIYPTPRVVFRGEVEEWVPGNKQPARFEQYIDVRHTGR